MYNIDLLVFSYVVARGACFFSSPELLFRIAYCPLSICCKLCATSSFELSRGGGGAQNCNKDANDKENKTKTRTTRRQRVFETGQPGYY